MIKKIIFTVTPIFSIPPKGAAAVETWIYQVAKKTFDSSNYRLYSKRRLPNLHKSK